MKERRYFTQPIGEERINQPPEEPIMPGVYDTDDLIGIYNNQRKELNRKRKRTIDLDAFAARRVGRKNNKGSTRTKSPKQRRRKRQ